MIICLKERWCIIYTHIVVSLAKSVLTNVYSMHRLKSDPPPPLQRKLSSVDDKMEG